MREIKFRIWNGAEMVYDVTVGRFGVFYVNPLNNGIDPDDSASLTPLTTKYHEDTPVMQYTGVHDVEEREIYEGDIIEYIKETFPEDSDVLVYVTKRDQVVFSGGQFQASKSSFGWEGEDLIYLPTSIVIGNIYQNPDLLK